MMPVSTPQNAVVYGSGIFFDVIGILLIVALIPVMARLVGLV